MTRVGGSHGPANLIQPIKGALCPCLFVNVCYPD